MRSFAEASAVDRSSFIFDLFVALASPHHRRVIRWTWINSQRATHRHRMCSHCRVTLTSLLREPSASFSLFASQTTTRTHGRWRVDRLKSRCWTCFAKFVSCSQHRCCCRSSSSDRCYYVNSRLPKSTTIPSETTTIPDGPPPSIVNATTPIEAVIAGAFTDAVPANLQPSLRGASGDKPEIYDNGCHVGLTQVEPKICVYGDVASDFTVALYGDSHAAQWFPALNQIAIDHQWRLVILTKMGCTTIDLITANSLVGPTYPGCRPWRESS